MKLIAYTDGATSETNPGPAGVGVVFIDGDLYESVDQAGQDLLDTICEPIGWTTNNVAEYRAVVAALEYWILEWLVRQEDGAKLEIRSDSLLVVDQLNGNAKVRNHGLKPWYAQIRQLLRIAGRVKRSDGKRLRAKMKIVHIPREENRRADKLSKEAAGIARDTV